MHLVFQCILWQKKAPYDVKELFKSSGVVGDNLNLVWGGGEPTILKEFDDVFNYFSEDVNF